MTPTPSEIQLPDRGDGPPPGSVPLPPGLVSFFTTRGVARARGCTSRALTAIEAVSEGVMSPPETVPNRGRDGGEIR